MKTFKGDFNKFINKIKKVDNFAITRFGDGELKIINSEYINLLKKGNGEFIYDNNNKDHEFYSLELKKSFNYIDDNYFVGIPCKCCVGEEKYIAVKEKSKQPESNLTWANIFVNSNYKRFDSDLVSSLSKRKIVLVYNKNGNLNNFPIKVEKEFKVGTNAWMEDYSLISNIIDYVNINNIKDYVFIICAGPLANIMVHKLWMNNKNNTYIDAGSIFDKYFSIKLTRRYQVGGPTLNKTCIW